MTKTERFMKVLLENSISNDWDFARNEWVSKELKYSPERTSICICGQKNIEKTIIIKNIKNNNELEIGYNCWKTVMKRENLDTKFKQLRNQYILKKYGIFNIPSEYITVCNFEHYIINEWEFMFLLNIISTTYEYTEKQREILKKLINKIKYVDDSKIIVKGFSFSSSKYKPGMLENYSIFHFGKNDDEYDKIKTDEEFLNFPMTIIMHYNNDKYYVLKRKIKQKYLDY